MSDTTIETLLRDGLEALRAGERERAFRLLAQAVRRDPTNERAWLLLAGAVTDVEQRRNCLERVLQLNPQHEMARRGLASLPPPAPPSAPPAAAPAVASRLPASAASTQAGNEAEHSQAAVRRVGPLGAPTAPAPVPPVASAPSVVAVPVPLAASAPPIAPAAPVQASPAASSLPLPRPSPTQSESATQELNALRPKTLARPASDRLLWIMVLLLGVVMVIASLAYAFAIMRA